MPQIILIKPHTHAGKHYSAGKRLEIDKPVADWLIEQGIARLKNTTGTPADTQTKTSDSKDS